MLSLHNTHHGPGVERSISESADHTGVGGLGISSGDTNYGLSKLNSEQHAMSLQWPHLIHVLNVAPLRITEAKTHICNFAYCIFICFWLVVWCFLFLCARWQKPAVLLATCSAERGLEVIFQGYFYQNGSWMIFNVVIRFWSEWNWCSATCLNTIRIWKHTAHPDPYHFFPQTEPLNFDGFSFFQFSLL